MKLLCVFLAVVGSGVTLANAQQLSPRAQQLGLLQTWTAPLPANTSDGPVSAFIRSEWHNPSSYFYGASNLVSQKDPINASTTPTLQVLYSKGSYSPIGTKSENGIQGGAEFYSQPFGNQSFDSVLLRYDIAFDAGFDWVLGGKLPGIFGGRPGDGCSGGEQAIGSNCFSVRLMWREQGAGEAYVYLPTSKTLCQQPLVTCNSRYGTSISRGLVQLKKFQWSTVEMYVKLNDGSQSNGILQVWQDGSLVISQTSLQYRTSNAIAVSSLMFSTFFGGGSAQYATQQDTHSYFKNIELSVGSPVVLSQASRSVPSCLFLVVLLSVYLFQ